MANQLLVSGPLCTIVKSMSSHVCSQKESASSYSFLSLEQIHGQCHVIIKGCTKSSKGFVILTIDLVIGVTSY